MYIYTGCLPNYLPDFSLHENVHLKALACSVCTRIWTCRSNTEYEIACKRDFSCRVRLLRANGQQNPI